MGRGGLRSAAPLVIDFDPRPAPRIQPGSTGCHQHPVALAVAVAAVAVAAVAVAGSYGLWRYSLWLWPL